MPRRRIKRILEPIDNLPLLEWECASTRRWALLEKIKASLPEYVDRKTAFQALNGEITPKMLANADRRGTGPKGRVKNGRKVAYPRDSFMEWIQPMFL